MPHFLWVIRQGQICAWRFFCALLVMKSNPDSTQIFALRSILQLQEILLFDARKMHWKVMVMTGYKKSNNKYHLLSKIWQLCKKICAQWRMSSLGSVGTCTITFTYYPKWNKTENAFQLDRGKKTLWLSNLIFSDLWDICVLLTVFENPPKNVTYLVML